MASNNPEPQTADSLSKIADKLREYVSFLDATVAYMRGPDGFAVLSIPHMPTLDKAVACAETFVSGARRALYEAQRRRGDFRGKVDAATPAKGRKKPGW